MLDPLGADRFQDARFPVGRRVVVGIQHGELVLDSLESRAHLGHGTPPVRFAMHGRSPSTARETRACIVPGFSSNISPICSNVNPC